MIKDFISLFFPNTCFGCSSPLAKGENRICTICRIGLPKTQSHEIKSADLYDRFFEVQKLQDSLAYLYFQKGGIVQNLLFALKYKDQPEIGEMLGKWYGQDLGDSGYQGRYDVIVPVPLHSTRRRSRGYNQSDYFAKGLAESLQLPWVADLVERKKKSQSQTKKSRIERWENVDNIFHVKSRELLDKRVLLVDDVITTGATMSACAQSLEAAGCSELSMAAIALAQ